MYMLWYVAITKCVREVFVIRRIEEKTDADLYHYVKHIHKCLDQFDRAIIFELAKRLKRANDKLSVEDRV